MHGALEWHWAFDWMWLGHSIRTEIEERSLVKLLCKTGGKHVGVNT